MYVSGTPVTIENSLHPNHPDYNLQRHPTVESIPRQSMDVSSTTDFTAEEIHAILHPDLDFEGDAVQELLVSAR